MGSVRREFSPGRKKQGPTGPRFGQASGACLSSALAAGVPGSPIAGPRRPSARQQTTPCTDFNPHTALKVRIHIP